MRIEIRESLWEGLRRQLLLALDANKGRGRQKALADHLSTSRQSLNAWLAGKAMPNAEMTLRLQEWVDLRREAQQPQQKQSGRTSAEVRPPKTRKGKNKRNEKSKSDPKEKR